MSYTLVPLTNDINIDYVVSIRYFEYMNDFVFEGEAHDFWEFVCVDNGEIEVYDGENWHLLHKGDVIFHKPMEFHALRATGKAGSALVVISFGSSSPAMDFFKKRRFVYTEQQRELLSNIIIEAKKTFETPLGDPYLTEMIKREETEIGSQQLIRVYLQLFLIDAIRRNTETFSNIMRFPASATYSTTHHKRSDDEIIASLKQYFEKNITRPLTVNEICHDNYISYSRLKQVFRLKLGCGVLEYFNLMRTERAKELIREGELNISEISGFLGYSSIHYFSRHFKQTTGMAPSEYAQSIKALAERKISL